MKTILLEKSINKQTIQLIRYIADKNKDYTVQTIRNGDNKITFQEKYIPSYIEACEEYRTQYQYLKERVHEKEKTRTIYNRKKVT
ncbi:hypothetical protein IJD15_00540 [bacterium]|nr:hypothetical protein [bacterium]